MDSEDVKNSDFRLMPLTHSFSNSTEPLTFTAYAIHTTVRKLGIIMTDRTIHMLLQIWKVRWSCPKGFIVVVVVVALAFGPFT